MLANQSTASVMAARASCCPSAGVLEKLLFRGLRIKVGIDVGPVTTHISHVSARVQYRGRVLNRAGGCAEAEAAGHLAPAACLAAWQQHPMCAVAVSYCLDTLGHGWPHCYSVPPM
jgi:hypothetical protein